MPLVLERNQVREIYAESEEREWILPAFNSENLTTSEAILSSAVEYGKSIGVEDLPVIIGITNNYKSRPQSSFYSHTRRWDMGMKLFLKELEVLSSEGSPFADLRVMIHLDHIQWDTDLELLQWDMGLFSSIMYDASTLPMDQNIEKTAAFAEEHSGKILIEGACDEIAESLEEPVRLTTPDDAHRYLAETGVDIVVANLGTEHRASGEELLYRGDIARAITTLLGKGCLCLHGTSSVPLESLDALFDDGIRRVNIWTALERDSSATLFQHMVKNASKVAGKDVTGRLVGEGFLGSNLDTGAGASVNYCTTTYRQGLIFETMKQLVREYLVTFYRNELPGN